MAYKQYKHKLNLIGPGQKMFAIIMGLIAVAFLCFVLHWNEGAIGVMIVDGILIVIFVILLVVEQHEDKVLNAQAIRLDAKLDTAIKKKSFALNYNGGVVWCEHLDALGDSKEILMNKFKESLPIVARESSPSYIVVNLDESLVDEEILKLILYSYRDMKKSIQKVAFVGLSRYYKHMLTRIKKASDRPMGFVTACIDDYEKAKAWVIGEND